MDIELFSSNGTFVKPDQNTLDALSAESRQRIERVMVAAEISEQATADLEETEAALHAAVRAQREAEVALSKLKRADPLEEWARSRGKAE